jgi:uncharacterized protein
MSFFNTLWLTLIELAPWLFFGALVSALMHKWLPEGLISRELQGNKGVLKSILLGVPLPLCSCGVIPAGIGLKKEGASDGSSIGFLISTPQTGVDSILVSASFLGWPFALFKMLSAAITGLVGGMLVEYFGGLSPEQEKHKKEQLPQAKSIKKRTSWSEAWDHGVQLIRSIWGWLIVGVVISAVIQTLIPPEWLKGLTGWWAPLLALAISIPLYVCATASVPIAAALVAGGLPTGAALVFLMAGPATNVATIGAVRGSFGNRNTFIYLGTVVFGSLILGVGFDFLLLEATIQQQHQHHESWWAVLSAIILLFFFLYFAYEELRLKLQQRSLTHNTDQLEFPLAGLTCNGCVAKLNKHLQQEPTIEYFNVVLSPPTLTVQTTLSELEVAELVKGAGFTAFIEMEFNIEGLHCGGCVSTLSSKLIKESSIWKHTISLEEKKLSVSSSLSEHSIIQIVQDAGFEAKTLTLAKH